MADWMEMKPVLSSKSVGEFDWVVSSPRWVADLCVPFGAGCSQWADQAQRGWISATGVLLDQDQHS